jgi:hypothetical protein
MLEQFIKLIKEGELADAIDLIKQDLSERAKDEVAKKKDEVAEEYKMKKKVKESDEEDKEELEEDDKDFEGKGSKDFDGKDPELKESDDEDKESDEEELEENDKDFDDDEPELAEGSDNLPGKSTHITTTDFRSKDGVVPAGTVLRHIEDDEFEVRAGKAKGKVFNFDKQSIKKL